MEEKFSYDMIFEKLYKDDRKDVPASICVPFPQGELTDESFINVLDGDRKLPVQTKVTARHKDGSIKFVMVRFICDLKGNSKNKFTINFSASQNGHQNNPAEGDIEGEELRDGKNNNTCLAIKADDAVEINTGVIKMSVRDGSEKMFAAFESAEGLFTPSEISGPIFSEAGNTYKTIFDLWEIEENGPLYCRVTGRGHFAGVKDIHFELRLDLFQGKSYIDIRSRLINTTPDRITPDSWYFRVLGNQGKKALRTLSGRSNYRTTFKESSEAGLLTEKAEASDVISIASEMMNETFYGTFFSDSTWEDGGVTAVIHRAFQNFPKTLTASDREVKIYLIPEVNEGCGLNNTEKVQTAARVSLGSGMSREQRFLLYLHGPEEDRDSIDDLALIYQMPDIPCLPREVYKRAGVIPDIIEEREQVDSDFEYALINMADGHSRTYGMMNFGDVPDMGYTIQGRGKGRLVWSNNEYDYPHAMFLMYMRSGERRYLDCACVAASHWMDVDVCHYSTDPYRIGGQWEHCAGHIEGQVMACSHEWVEGLLDMWHFTGDRRAYDTAIGIGENVRKLLTLPEYRTPGASSARENGWALRTLTALYAETWDESWLSECERIVDIFHSWEEKFGAFLSPYTDNTQIRVPFMIAVAIGSLMRYYRLFPDEKLKGLIVRAAEDIVDNCVLECGGFYYKEMAPLKRLSLNPLPLEAMAIGYELTGDRKFLEAGYVTYKNIIKNAGQGNIGPRKIVEDAVIEEGRSTKNFAQVFLPLTLYHKALVWEGMI
ncbi:MAG: hypothetical protein K6E33_06175 [Lachnospiraceae bacterium]|nr:hypothetical protein [Lachnospiraceae bacterium]